MASTSFQSIEDPDGIGTTVVNGINDNGEQVRFLRHGADRVWHYRGPGSVTSIKSSRLVFLFSFLGSD
jgi:hypothetical protein